MSDDERQRWDEKYRSGEYQSRPTAGAFLESWLPRLPVGRALDVACGTWLDAVAEVLESNTSGAPRSVKLNQCTVRSVCAKSPPTKRSG